MGVSEWGSARKKPMQSDKDPNMSVRQKKSKSDSSLFIQSRISPSVPTVTKSLPLIKSPVPGAGHSL